MTLFLIGVLVSPVSGNDLCGGWGFETIQCCVLRACLDHWSDSGVCMGRFEL